MCSTSKLKTANWEKTTMSYCTNWMTWALSLEKLLQKWIKLGKRMLVWLKRRLRLLGCPRVQVKKLLFRASRLWVSRSQGCWNLRNQEEFHRKVHFRQGKTRYFERLKGQKLVRYILKLSLFQTLRKYLKMGRSPSRCWALLRPEWARRRSTTTKCSKGLKRMTVFTKLTSSLTGCSLSSSMLIIPSLTLLWLF